MVTGMKLNSLMNALLWCACLPAGEAAMSYSLPKPTANVHLGKEASSLLKIEGGCGFRKGVNQ